MEIHPKAFGFAASAETYEIARPDYPDEALEWVVDRAALGRGDTVVDVAAGTGKFTRQLVARGFHVVAVEPVRQMLDVLRRVLPDVEAVEGVAEQLPVADNVADAVTVAQAFHWFDGDRAVREFHRVLRDGGLLALLWNVRNEDDELQMAYADLLRPYRGDDYPNPPWTEPLERSPLFDVEERWFPHTQMLDTDGLVQRAASVSFVAQLDEGERADLLDRVRALAPEGEFEFPYVTKVFTARSR